MEPSAALLAFCDRNHARIADETHRLTVISGRYRRGATVAVAQLAATETARGLADAIAGAGSGLTGAEERAWCQCYARGGTNPVDACEITYEPEPQLALGDGSSAVAELAGVVRLMARDARQTAREADSRLSDMMQSYLDARESEMELNARLMVEGGGDDGGGAQAAFMGMLGPMLMRSLQGRAPSPTEQGNSTENTSPAEDTATDPEVDPESVADALVEELLRVARDHPETITPARLARLARLAPADWRDWRD